MSHSRWMCWSSNGDVTVKLPINTSLRWMYISTQKFQTIIACAWCYTALVRQSLTLNTLNSLSLGLALHCQSVWCMYVYSSTLSRILFSISFHNDDQRLQKNNQHMLLQVSHQTWEFFHCSGSIINKISNKHSTHLPSWIFWYIFLAVSRNASSTFSPLKTRKR